MFTNTSGALAGTLAPQAAQPHVAAPNFPAPNFAAPAAVAPQLPVPAGARPVHGVPGTQRVINLPPRPPRRQDRIHLHDSVPVYVSPTAYCGSRVHVCVYAGRHDDGAYDDLLYGFWNICCRASQRGL